MMRRESKTGLLAVLTVCAGTMLSGCDGREDPAEGLPPMPPDKTAAQLRAMTQEERKAWDRARIAARKARDAAEREAYWAAQTPKGLFTTEIRITAEWKGEVADAVGVRRCKVYDSDPPKWATAMSGGDIARDTFRCEASRIAMVEFSDGTQFAFEYWMNPYEFRSVEFAVSDGRSIVENADGKDTQGRPRRVWFDPDLDIPTPKSISKAGSGLWGQPGKWTAVSLVVRAARSHQESDEVTLSIPEYSGFTEGTGGPRILRIVTTRISDDTDPTTVPEKFEAFEFHEAAGNYIKSVRKQNGDSGSDYLFEWKPPG